jgi:hypothetical protein
MIVLHVVILALESSVVSPGSLRRAPVGFRREEIDKSNMFLPGPKPTVLNDADLYTVLAVSCSLVLWSFLHRLKH